MEEAMQADRCRSFHASCVDRLRVRLCRSGQVGHARVVGPGRCDQVSLARSIGPGRSGHDEWARPSETGRSGQVARAISIVPGRSGRQAELAGASGPGSKRHTQSRKFGEFPTQSHKLGRACTRSQARSGPIELAKLVGTIDVGSNMARGG